MFGQFLAFHCISNAVVGHNDAISPKLLTDGILLNVNDTILGHWLIWMKGRVPR